MVFKVGDIVKIKKCKFIEHDSWGNVVVIVKDESLCSKGYVELRYPMDLDAIHNFFVCRVECLKKVEVP